MFSQYSKYVTDTPDGINKLKKGLKEAETVVIGAGAGLSTSAGFIYTGERLQMYFGDFVDKYNIPDMYSGGFMVMQLPPEMYWAYWSRYIYRDVCFAQQEVCRYLKQFRNTDDVSVAKHFGFSLQVTTQGTLGNVDLVCQFSLRNFSVFYQLLDALPRIAGKICS